MKFRNLLIIIFAVISIPLVASELNLQINDTFIPSTIKKGEKLSFVIQGFHSSWCISDSIVKKEKLIENTLYLSLSTAIDSNQGYCLQVAREYTNVISIDTVVNEDFNLVINNQFYQQITLSEIQNKNEENNFVYNKLHYSLNDNVLLIGALKVSDCEQIVDLVIDEDVDSRIITVTPIIKKVHEMCAFKQQYVSYSKKLEKLFKPNTALRLKASHSKYIYEIVR